MLNVAWHVTACYMTCYITGYYIQLMCSKRFTTRGLREKTLFCSFSLSLAACCGADRCEKLRLYRIGVNGPLCWKHVLLLCCVTASLHLRIFQGLVLRRTSTFPSQRKDVEIFLRDHQHASLECAAYPLCTYSPSLQSKWTSPQLWGKAGRREEWESALTSRIPTKLSWIRPAVGSRTRGFLRLGESMN